MDLICRKIDLKPDMTVLDLGCGFGSFAKFAAEKYGAIVMGVNISREQVKLGRELCAGLPIELVLDDYRNANGKFDRVVSIGIMDQVGYKHYRTYMKTSIMPGPGSKTDMESDFTACGVSIFSAPPDVSDLGQPSHDRLS